MRQVWLMILLVAVGYSIALAPSVAYAKDKEKDEKVVVLSPAEKAKRAKTDARFETAFQEIVDAYDEPRWNWVLRTGLFGLLLVCWVGTTDWVNRSSQIHKLGWHKWNPIVYLPFMFLGVAFFFLPSGFNFWLRWGILLAVYLATIIPYIVTYNKAVESHQTVLTTEWWRYAFAAAMGSLGINITTERKAQYEMGAAVDLEAHGAADANTDNANLLTARQSPGYLLLKDLMVEAVSHRAERVMLDYTQQAVSTRYEVDGVWVPGEAKDRESGDVLLAVMKTLANLDIKERRKKQKGQFSAKYEGKAYLVRITSEGTKTGERVVLTFVGKKQALTTFEELGIRDATQEKWSELMARDQGILIFSTMPGEGLTTIASISISETDRLMRDFVAIEPANKPEAEIQNVTPHTYDPAQGQKPSDILPDLIRTYPNVYVVRDMNDPAASELLLDEVRDEHLLITTVQARDSAEALLRLLQMKVPHKPFAKYVTGVLYQRLVRKLCPTCRVGYPPPPAVLQKLGIPAGKVELLYRPPKPEELESDKPCPDCQGIGYVGRTGIFELLEVNDKIREILLKQPKVDLVRKAARAAGQRNLQEEAILLVAKGVTSIPEIMRVLK